MLFKHIPKKKVLLLIGDIILISLAYLLSPLIRFGVFLFAPFQSIGEWLIILLIYLLCLYTAELYSLEMKFLRARYVFRFSMAMFAATVIALSASVFFPLIMAGHGALPLINAGLIFVFTYVWRLVFERLFQRYLKREIRTVIVGAGHTGRKTYELIKEHPNFFVIGFVDDDPQKYHAVDSSQVLGNLSVLDDLVKQRQTDQIIIAIKHIKNREILKKSIGYIMQGIQVLTVPSFYEVVDGKIPVNSLTDEWFINNSFIGLKSDIYSSKIKRLADLTVSIIGMIISIPIIIVAAILIKLESVGPIFYWQKRVGLNNSIFEMLKLRSMNINAEINGAVWATDNDSRVTRVGKIIRKLRIDELPQFWNVFKGDLSLIGPRPERPEFVELLTEKIPYYMLRLMVKPGITGWAQVNYPYGNTVEDALEKLQYDLFYIKNLSFFLDFHVVMRTIRVMLLGKGAK